MERIQIMYTKLFMLKNYLLKCVCLKSSLYLFNLSFPMVIK